MGGYAPDGEVLRDVVRRLPFLAALREGPRTRQQLESALDASRTTIHRATTTLEDHGLLTREDGAYTLTPIGASVAREAVRFAERTTDVHRLAPLFEGTDCDGSEIDLEPFAGATVTTASPRDPYGPFRRFTSLVREADRLRWLDRSTVAPATHTELTDRFLDGLEAEVIVEPAVARRFGADNPDLADTLVDVETLDVYLHDDVPFGLVVSDERVGIGGYDTQTGSLSVYVDTDGPEAIAWANALFEEYRVEARAWAESSLAQ